MQHSPFSIRGVIEGFYGPFYTWPERNDLIRFLGEHGFNLYIYGPKNDRQHRARWWESYPAEELRQFAATVVVAAAAGVRFCYAISPLGYAPAADFERLTGKLAELLDAGVRHFSILVDDLACAAHGATSCPLCPWSAAQDVAVGNALLAWLLARDPRCTLSLCPTLYHGEAPFPDYLHELGGLDPAIAVFYTGPAICSPTISAADARAFGAAIRRPPLLWDNYPVNDLAMRPELHLGPIQGRAADLPVAVGGVVVNPMLQPEASKIPLLCWAEYLADPAAYEPWAAWERALRQIGGERNYAALRRFGETALDSCLGSPAPGRLGQLAGAALASLPAAGSCVSPALAELGAYLEVLDESCYELKFRMANLALRQELLPWVECLDEWVWVGKRALRLAEAHAAGRPAARLARDLAAALADVEWQPKRTAGSVLAPLALALLEAEAQSPAQLAALPGSRVDDVAVA